MDKNYGYKWTKGFGIAILLMCILFAGAALSQSVTSGSVNTPSGFSIDLTTGNLIGYDSSLKTNNGWTSTTGAAGNWTPYGSPQGSFDATNGYTFSYVGEELGVAGINLGGISHGYQNSSAVFVTGFMYGLKYRFPCANSIGGSCTDTNGPQDTLRVEVGYYPATGAATFYLHQLGLKNQTDGNSAYNPTWQTLAETVTFAGAKPLAQAGSVNMGIYGMDAGFWACLMPDCYGPQVKDAYIRANYSVDPCILNPAYNPSCPGFNQVLQGALSPVFLNSYSISTALPHIGGGVQLHGFDYGFNWSNYGECYNRFMFWCTDWRTDGGATINFRITDKMGNILYTDSQYREGNNMSGSYSSKYLFTESKNSLDMGNVNWWLSGVWNHLAVTGWTRPIWSPDPCFDQPLYSKNCSNFEAEIKRLAAEQKEIQEKSLAATVATVTSTSPTPTGTVTTTISDANTSDPKVTTTTTTASATTEQPVSKNQTLVSASINTAPRIENRETSSTSFALSLINRNQERETTITNQASQNAMREAQAQSAQSMRQAENIAIEQTQKSIQASNQESSSTSSTVLKQQSQNNSLAFINPPATTSVVTVQGLPNFNNLQSNQMSIATTNSINNNTQSSGMNMIAPSIQNQIGTVVASIPNVVQQQTSQAINSFSSNEIERKLEMKDTISTQNNFITDKTNPITELIDNTKPTIASTTTQTNTQQVKSNVQDNDAAAGVSISSIARTPSGFNTYMVALTDAAFYAPKEIYRNQKTVDNARALRQLASDRLHQQMVDQQYLPR